MVISSILGTFVLAMKRLLSLFILVTYMASAIGFSYSLHYCAGKFKQVCFTADTEKNCCGADEVEGCCTNKVVQVKCKDNHTPANHTIVPILLSCIIPVIHIAFPTAKKTTDVYQTYIAQDTSPPHIFGIPIYLKIRVIRV